jgi:putative hydrolase of the HAD superfamily
MKSTISITTLFLDIGDVLITDGWDHLARKRAATAFKLNLAEINERHFLTFETFEDGKLTLDEYWVWLSSSKSAPSVGHSFGGSCSRNRKLAPE